MTMKSDPVVKVAEGKLRGTIASTPSGKLYYSFQGIPYAEPPVGTLRFRDPRYPRPWVGIRDAIKPGSKCAQMDPLKPKKFEGSDDCLYLNIYTPTLPKTLTKDNFQNRGASVNSNSNAALFDYKENVVEYRNRTISSVNDLNQVNDRIPVSDPVTMASQVAAKPLSALEGDTDSSIQNDKRLLPVMVFIHGGRFLAGYADYYRPDYFLEQDVIVVTVNYRFAALGMLCLDIPEVPGNAGHKDVIFALRWIRENVHNFNGNPNNVTVMGESAGGGLVSGLLVSPLSEGLVHKVIVESGSCIHDIYMWKEDNLEKAREIVREMGAQHRDPYDILNYLQKAPLESILEALYTIERRKTYFKAFLTAVIEKKFNGVENFYIENPINVFKNGAYLKIPMILGYNSLEGAFFLWRDSKGNIIYDMDFATVVPMLLGIGMRSDKAKMYVEDLKRFYFKGKPVNEQTLSNLVELLTDQYFVRDMHILAEQCAKHVKDVYFYEFSYRGTLNSSILKGMPLEGATHSDILGYQFLRPKKADSLNDSDKRVIRLLAEGWCSFIKHGKPAWQTSQVEWLPVQKDKLYTLEVSSELRLLEYPLRERMEFCKSLLDKYKQKKSKL